MKLCIMCNKNKATIPDRNVQGRPIKKICNSCHAQRLSNDIKGIIQHVKRLGN